MVEIAKSLGEMVTNQKKNKKQQKKLHVFECVSNQYNDRFMAGFDDNFIDLRRAFRSLCNRQYSRLPSLLPDNKSIFINSYLSPFKISKAARWAMYYYG
jgi:hypothetical protein